MRETGVAVVNGIGATVDHRSHVGPVGAIETSDIACIAIDDQLMPAFAGAERVGTVAPTQRRLRAAIDQIHARHVLHIVQSDCQGVVAAANEIDAFDGGNARCAAALIGDSGQIKRDAGTRQTQGIHSGTTIHPRQLTGVAAATKVGGERADVAGIENNRVIARAAVNHIRSATTGNRVVTCVAN